MKGLAILMKITPEQGGIPSLAIKEYLESLEKAELSIHSVIIAKGNDILFEKYYEPFNADFLHRIYSQTKSFVALAVGFVEQDGLVNLDDPISKYFPLECENIEDAKMGEQTVRQMLMMSTPKNEKYWFNIRTDDRVRDYFKKAVTTEPCGSKFQYDSSGSFVLGAMVERLTNKSLVDYLYEKLFSKIGISREDVKCLKAPGGHSWGDSAMLMKPRDLVKAIRFSLDKGKVNGEQILNEKFMSDATSALISTEHFYGKYAQMGYGYLIWRTYENSFFFNGMGAQLAVGSPDKDLVLVVTSDNQGIDEAKDVILNGYFDMVYSKAGEPLPENKEAFEELESYAKSLKLFSENGEKSSPIAEEINGKTFVLEENQMGIENLKFTFCKDKGILEYKNATGQKVMVFGMCENCFTVFPEEGYSREVGSEYAIGNYYKCANSAAWKSENRLVVNVQAIDEYFGRLWMTFDFENDNITVTMRKSAEDFFTTYEGTAKGKKLI